MQIILLVKYTLNCESMKEFYEFGLWQSSDHIASIGCGYGWWEVSLCLHYPAQHLTLVDPLVNEDDIQDSIEYFTEKTGLTWKTEFELNPENLQKKDQIWVFNAWHEFKDRLEMLAKIKSALNEGGIVIIEEEISKVERLQHEGCGKDLFFEQEIIEEFEQMGLQYVATQVKDDVAIYLKFRK
jgi:SAM-dependent methyltransferase